MIQDLINKNFKLNGTSYSKESLISHFKENELYHKFLISWFDKRDYITVETSGSTGTPKSIRLKKIDMISSAKLTGKYFKLLPNSRVINCLSLNYIAGKMMLIRSLVLGWDLYLFPVSIEPIKKLKSKFDFIALTPMQLQNSLDNINYIKTIIVGGSPVNIELRDKILKLESTVFETYGMTETLTHIAVRNLSKNEIEFSALPGIEFSEINGCLAIDTDHLSFDTIKTNDVIKLISSKNFIWIGRKDFIINSGGIKINPEKIEKKISSNFTNKFIISSINDKFLGEKVAIVFEKSIPKNYNTVIESLLKYEKPKIVFFLNTFPETNGKINRLRIKSIIQSK